VVYRSDRFLNQPACGLCSDLRQRSRNAGDLGVSRQHRLGANWTTLGNTAFQFVNYNEARGYPLPATNSFSAYRILVAHPANPTPKAPWLLMI